MKKIFLSAMMLLSGLSIFSAERNDTVTIWMAGDSTMANKPTDSDKQERGWGQMLNMMLQGAAKVNNHAVNGQSSKSFVDGGRWNKMMTGVEEGDFVIIQFGHNDEKSKNPKRYTVPGGTFDEYLTSMVRDVKAKGATPILMSSIVRRNFPDNSTEERKDSIDRVGPVANTKTEGTILVDTHGEYLLSPINVAVKEGVVFINMNHATHELVQAMGTEKSKELYMWIPAGKFQFKPEGQIDNTHLNIHGATVVARMAADSLAARIPTLAPYIKK